MKKFNDVYVGLDVHKSTIAVAFVRGVRSQAQYFGEIAMLTNHWSCETVLAKGDVVALVLDRDDFMEILGDDFAAIAKLTLDKKALVSLRICYLQHRFRLLFSDDPLLYMRI